MTDSPRLTPDAAVQDIAIIWYVRLQDPIASEADCKAFFRWLSESPAHQQAYTDVQNLWGELEQPAQILRDSLAAQPQPRSLRRTLALPALAACLMLGMAALLGWQDPGMLQRWQADYATSPGQQASFVLADGSRVFLDSDSALNFSSDEANRRNAELLRGRAWFDVEPDASRPFSVRHGALSIEVLGTSFDVASYGEYFSVAVEHGRVRVNWDEQRLLQQDLTTGDQLSFSPGQSAQVTTFNADLIGVWRQGMYVFDQVPLRHVARLLERNLSGRILVAHDIAELPVTGVFRQSDPAAMLNGLTASMELRIRHIPGLGIWLSR